MQRAIEKADTLIEALGWIRRFRGRITVIKLGGSVMEDAEALQHVLLDIVFMETVGMRPVVVHGGGAAISRAMEAARVRPRFVQGRRCTDAATLEIVERVLAGQVNGRLVEGIQRCGGQAVGLTFPDRNVLFGRRLELRDAEGRPVDLGFVGRVTRVDGPAIRRCCDEGVVPVIPSLCCDERDGRKLNVNADTAAMAVAEGLAAEKLVFLSDVNGVRRVADDPGSLIHTLSVPEARRLIAEGVVRGGMIPKIEACLETLARGVGKVHIIDGRLRHSLLLEVYTTEGVGTQIVPGPPAGAGGEPRAERSEAAQPRER